MKNKQEKDWDKIIDELFKKQTILKEQEEKLKAYRELSFFTIKTVEKEIEKLEKLKSNEDCPIKSITSFIEKKINLEELLNIIKDDTKTIIDL